MAMRRHVGWIAGLAAFAFLAGTLGECARLGPAGAAAFAREASHAGGQAWVPEAAVTAATVLTELAPQAANLTADQVAALLETNFGPIGLAELRASTGATGAGVKIAIIDSGIDPGHPDLQRTPSGGRKIVDWKDFTTEGQVNLTQAVSPGETYTAPDGRTYALPDLPAGAAVRFGYWEESRVSGRINRDLNRNGSPVDKFGVLAVALGGSGFDRVWVDTDDDRSFRDEAPLRVYRVSGDAQRLGPFRTGQAAEAQLSFVLADIDPDGNWVSFGFDSLGHGTQVAGVAAASGPGMTGIAPGAELMALKVINSRDEGSWFAIRQAIQYAAEQGAQVINVSLGGLPLAATHDAGASAFLDQIASAYGVLINLAAGNTGPGLSSGATLGSPSAVLSAGAYYSPEMWRRDYGVVVPSEGVWWRSGMGPRADGAFLPSLVAPGGSPTTSPRWLHRSGYTTAVGTSVATAHVSGAAALLDELARREGLPSDPHSLRRAFQQSARRLEGVEDFEQGVGLLQLPAAYQALRQIREVPVLRAVGPGGGGGLYIRAYQPGNEAFLLTNQSGAATRIEVRSTAVWVQPEFQSMTLPARGERTLPLRFVPPSMPGVYTAFVNLFHPGQEAPSISLPVTFVQPVPLDRQNRFNASQQLEVARNKRYFVEVAPGTPALRVTARVQAGLDGLADGTIQVQIFRPDGELLFRSDPVGHNGRGLTVNFATSQPLPGVWEVVVTALPDSEGRYLSATYALAVEAPRMAPELPLRLTVEPEEVVTVNVPVTHQGAPTEVQVSALGLSRVDPSSNWRTLSKLDQIDEFTLPGITGLLILEIEDVYPSTSDLDIVLYRYEVSTGWRRYWTAQNPTSGRESLVYANLPPGRYRVYVQHNGPPPADLRYQYRRRVALQAYNLSVDEPARRRVTGQTWEVPMKIYAPTSPGRYLGYVILSDANTGETLVWYPVEVSVGEPALQIRPMVSQLTVNRPGTVVLEVRDGGTGQLVDATLTVDGRRYTTRAGRVKVPVVPTAPVLNLDVSADVAGYQPFRAVIPVAASTGAASAAGLFGLAEEDPAQAEEKEQWRRRLEALLR